MSLSTVLEWFSLYYKWHMCGEGWPFTVFAQFTRKEHRFNKSIPSESCFRNKTKLTIQKIRFVYSQLYCFFNLHFTLDLSTSDKRFDWIIRCAIECITWFAFTLVSNMSSLFQCLLRFALRIFKLMRCTATRNVTNTRA